MSDDRPALLDQLGPPPGVLNVLPTDRAADVVSPMLSDPRLRKLTFTGSTETGRLLASRAAEGLLRVSMELGGNAPFIVCDDADLGAAVEGAMIAKMRNMGQACTAANRFLVHASLAHEFAEALAARMGEEVLARGTEPRSTVGP